MRIQVLLQFGVHILQIDRVQAGILDQSCPLRAAGLILCSQLICLAGHILGVLRMILLTLSLAIHCLRFLLRPEILLAEQDLDSVRLLAHVLRDEHGLVASILDFLRYQPTLVVLSIALESLKGAEVCVEPTQFGN